MVVSQNRWFIMENVEMDDNWGYPHLWKPPYGRNIVTARPKDLSIFDPPSCVRQPPPGLLAAML